MAPADLKPVVCADQLFKLVVCSDEYIPRFYRGDVLVWRPVCMQILITPDTREQMERRSGFDLLADDVRELEREAKLRIVLASVDGQPAALLYLSDAHPVHFRTLDMKRTVKPKVAAAIHGILVSLERDLSTPSQYHTVS